MNREVESIAATCLEHMHREEKMLESLQLVVQEMRKSLLDRDNQLDGIVQRNSELLMNVERISRDRRLLRQKLANCLGVTETAATLGLLIQHCDQGKRALLQAVQVRVGDAAKALNKSLVANSNLALQLLDILESVFTSLCGDPAKSAVYECSGRRRVA